MRPTPTPNPRLRHIIGDFSSVAEALDYASQGDTGANFYTLSGELGEAVPYSALRQQAIQVAQRLAQIDVSRKKRIALVAETSADFARLFYGCQYAGVLACPLPLQVAFGGQDAYIEQMASMVRASNAGMILAPDSIIGVAGKAAERAGVGILSFGEFFALPFDPARKISPLRADEEAYIQFSSGSTMAPKGIMVSQRALCANVMASLKYGMRMSPEERSFTWLPFSHNMGLVGFSIAAIFSQCSVDALPTAAFIRRPALWLELMSANGNTISYAPTFGYELAAQSVLKGDCRQDIDLSQWRVAGAGGDAIRPQVLQKFAEVLKPYGLRQRIFLPSYGMAEATMAISLPELDGDMVIDQPYEDSSASFVACGRPFPGHEVKVMDAEGNSLSGKTIGHLWFRGPSLMEGYLDNPQATADVMRPGGFMDTGDLGYLLDGQIVVTGRSKDMVLIRGRNIWPQDVEWAVENSPPFARGDAAAFSVERNGEEALVVLVQRNESHPEKNEELIKRLQSLIIATVGIPGRVVWVPPGSLPFTSSGKLSRAKAREKYILDEYGPA